MEHDFEQVRGKGPIVQLESWQEVLEALQTTYTTSFKDVCRLLRASRPWVNQYIKPFVPSIYLNSNLRGDKKTLRVNWVQAAAAQLGRPDMNESVWFNTEVLHAFLLGAVTSCTKQTKSLPMTYLMPPERVSEFADKRAELRSLMRAAQSMKELASLSAEYNSLPAQYYRQDDATKWLLNDQVYITKRTEAPATPVPLPDDFMKKWQAPHDLKGYGDADETIYRQLFRSGSIRIQLELQDETGKVGTKIFYVSDPNPIRCDCDDEGSIIVTEEAWQRYLKTKKRG